MKYCEYFNTIFGVNEDRFENGSFSRRNFFLEKDDWDYFFYYFFFGAWNGNWNELESWNW